jgi:hypothetical protein
VSLDDLREIDAGLDTIDVHEDLVAAEVVAQAVEEPGRHDLRCHRDGG